MPGKLFGFYRAKVVENNIEDNDFGAVRVFVPDLMTDLEPDFNAKEMGLIALPANNAIGGRNDEEEGSYGWGQVMIPPVGTWVWIFFEGGTLHKPFYMGSLDIKNTKLPPENRNVQDPAKVYTILRTQQGRTLVIADSEDVQRIELTGKKRINTPPSHPAGDDQESYTIDNNQTTILFDERDGKEKILIRTHKGDFLHIDIDEQMLQAYFKEDIRIKTDGSLHIMVGRDIHIKSSGNTYEETEGERHIKSASGTYDQTDGERHTISTGSDYNQTTGERHTTTVQNSFETVLGGDKNVFVSGNINTDGAHINDQSGAAQPGSPATQATPPQPIEPKGERDT